MHRAAAPPQNVAPLFTIQSLHPGTPAPPVPCAWREWSVENLTPRAARQSPVSCRRGSSEAVWVCAERSS